MSSGTVYHDVLALVEQTLGRRVRQSTHARLVWLLLGLLYSQSCHLSKMALALTGRGLSEVLPESLRRRLRRTLQDPEVCQRCCLHPWARAHLALGRPARLVLIVDATCQEDRWVVLTGAVAYRGRALPFAWSRWPANTPLTGPGLWERTEALLQTLAQLLPKGVPVIVVADRAFGCPAFIRLVVRHGWAYVLRVQRQVRFQDARGTWRALGQMVRRAGQRAKGRGFVFKKHKSLPASVVVWWRPGQSAPLCLVSSLPPAWDLIGLYRQRSLIETLFRDWKSQGWDWEASPVTEEGPSEALLVGLALATWLVIWIGEQWAEDVLAQPQSGRGRTLPWLGHLSLFQLGLIRCQSAGPCGGTARPTWTHWTAPPWSVQLAQHVRRAYLRALHLQYT